MLMLFLVVVNAAVVDFVVVVGCVVLVNVAVVEISLSILTPL